MGRKYYIHTVQSYRTNNNNEPFNAKPTALTFTLKLTLF